MMTPENFILEELFYLPMGNQVPVYCRPYIINADSRAIETISERMSSSKSGRINSNILSGITGNIIQTSSVGELGVIDNTWVSTKRFIFMLKVKSIDMFGNEGNTYIQGYTEYDGITANGNIDSSMMHYINNVIETSSMVISTPLGVIRKEKLARIYNVFGDLGNKEYFAQRPMDVLETAKLAGMHSVFDSFHDVQSYNMGNYVSPFNNNILGSNADNHIPTEYLSKIINTGILTNKEKEIHLGSYEISNQSNADSGTYEPTVGENRFIKYISMLGGFKTTKEVFNFNQLMQIDNSIFTRFKVFHLNKDYVNPIIASTPETGDHWHGQDPVTIKAYSLIESSVALAVKYGFNKIYFTASNMSNPSNLAEIFITNFNSFINLEEQDFNFLLELFKEKFINEIFMSETNGGIYPLHMDMYVDLLGTSKINLSFSGYQSNWYTVPTAASSLYSPVITVNQHGLNFMGEQVTSLIDTITANQQQSAMSYY